MTLEWTLAATQRLRAQDRRFLLYTCPTVTLFTPWAWIVFFRPRKRAGVDGVIIPDLIPEEALHYQRRRREAWGAFDLSGFTHNAAGSSENDRARYARIFVCGLAQRRHRRPAGTAQKSFGVCEAGAQRIRGSGCRRVWHFNAGTGARSRAFCRWRYCGFGVDQGAGVFTRRTILRSPDVCGLAQKGS